MLLGLIADTHIPESRPELWPQVFDAFRGVDGILHAGDIHDIFVLDQLHEVAPLWACRGNGDDGSSGRPVQPDHHRLLPTWDFELAGLRIGIAHDMPIPEYGTMTVERAMRRHFGHTELDVVVYGDTHVERIDQIGRTLFVNPGSPTYPHNMDTQLGTVGFLEVRDGRAHASIWQLTESGVEPFAWGRKWR